MHIFSIADEHCSELLNSLEKIKLILIDENNSQKYGNLQHELFVICEIMDVIKIDDFEYSNSEEIYILIELGKMSLTEINTLPDKEKFFLARFFLEKVKEEEKTSKEMFRK